MAREKIFPTILMALDFIAAIPPRLHPQAITAGTDLKRGQTDELNNAVSNLEWVSTRENQIHARNNGLEGSSKISMEIAEMIRKDNGSNRELAKKYGLKKTEIGLIRQNKRWVA